MPPLLSVFIDAASVTLIVLVACIFLRALPNHNSTKLVALLGVTVIANIISSRHDYAFALTPPFTLDLDAWHPFFNLLRNSTSAILLILVHQFFRDGQRFPKILFVVIVLQLFMEEPLGWILGEAWQANDTWQRVLVNEISPGFLQLGLSITALFWAAADRHSDLIETRRSTRVVMLIVLVGVVSLAVERIGFFSGQIPASWMYPIHIWFQLGQTLLLFALVISLSNTDVAKFVVHDNSPKYIAELPETVYTSEGTQQKQRVSQMSATENANTEQSKADYSRIQNALEHEYIYRQPGLSVHSLAQHLNLPEYRLRKIILEQMHYRNFNDLLHDYRIAEVCTALEDPNQNHLPILTLALSAGYQSIAPFNRAFKASKDETPSQFRTRVQQTTK